MRRTSGFTLIELMVTVAVVATLAAIAYPSYQDHVRRAFRAQGQQFMMDLAQRQEAFFLDNRAYATQIGNAAGQISITIPQEVSDHYNTAAADLLTVGAGPPATFVIKLAPTAGVTNTDGTLFLNNLQQRWRGTDGNNTYDEGHDCRWEDTKCTPS